MEKCPKNHYGISRDDALILFSQLDSMSKVLENIRRIRTSNGYSQDQMADLMDVERTTYNNFETGKTRLYSKSFSRFASVMGMSEEEIIFGEKPGLTHGYLQSGNLEDKINSLEEKVKNSAPLSASSAIV